MADPAKDKQGIPPEAREKHGRLVDQREADLGARRQADRRLSELHRDLEVVQDPAAQETIRAQIKRYSQTIPALDARWEASERTLIACHKTIRSGASFKSAARVKSPRQIEAVRADLRDLFERRREVDEAPPPRAEHLARVEAIIASEAERGRAEFDARIRGADPFSLSKLLREDGSASGTGAGVFLLWLFRNEIVNGLAEMIPPDGPNTMTDEARTAAIAKIDRQILALEREEEAAIEMADAEGRRIDRRADANPLAILGITEA